MIWVTRLNGSEMVVNSDLMEAIEATPDTVITLVDGKRYVVHERPEEIVALIRAFRASILTLIDEVQSPAPSAASATNLYVLPTDGRS